MSEDTLGPQAPSLLPARSPVSPRHVLGLTAELLPPGGGAPEAGAGRHVGAGAPARAVQQLALSVRAVDQPGQAGRETVRRDSRQPGPLSQADSSARVQESRQHLTTASGPGRRVGLMTQGLLHHVAQPVSLLILAALFMVIV